MKYTDISDEEKRRQEIMESTDPSMDEMGTVKIAYYGVPDMRMTRREAMLKGYDTGIGATWKSDKEIEEERQREEAEKERKEAEKRKRIEEIETSIDPRMDEIGQVFHPRMGDQDSSYYITMTRREALLEGYTNWKSNAEIEEEREKQEEKKRREDAEREKQKAEKRTKIEEVKASTDPSMDEIVSARIMVPLRRWYTER